MNDVERHGDLFVLVADEDMAQAVRGLLSRPQALKMAPQFPKYAGIPAGTVAAELVQRSFCMRISTAIVTRW